MNEFAHHATIQSEGVVTHVLVPVDEYQRLTGAHGRSATPPSGRQIDDAIAIWNSSKAEWREGEGALRQILREGIEQARRARKMSQGELGRRVGLSQPQVSRIENHPENATLGVLRRISDALADSSRGSAAKTAAPGKKYGKRGAKS